MDSKEKAKSIEEFRIHERDTGSADVQIALLSKRISALTEHLQKNKKTIPQLSSWTNYDGQQTSQTA